MRSKNRYAAFGGWVRLRWKSMPCLLEQIGGAPRVFSDKKWLTITGAKDLFRAVSFQ